MSKVTPPLPTATEPPPIPVGFDAYRMWDRWAQLRIGARAYMRSTMDRSGANEGACAGHFLYQLADDFNVTMHIEGPGVLYFVRTNCWHGSPWHYETDGVDHVVRETATADPQGMLDRHRWEQDPPTCTFEPEELLHPPLALTWTTTRGADLSWLPIAFEQSFRLAYGRTCYGTGYYIYHRYLPGASLTAPIRTFDWQTPPPPEVEELLDRAGTDIAPRVGTPEGERSGIREVHGALALQPGQPARLEGIGKGPAMLRALELSAPRERAVDFGAAWIRITWDDRELPSVESPLALFFGAGHLYRADDREFLVKGLPMHIRFDDSRVHLACYFPMPYFRSASVELVAHSGVPIEDVRWSIRRAPYDGPGNHVGYFHATYHDHPDPPPGEDLVLLDTRQTEGGGDWTGHFVGTSFIFSQRAFLNTLEAIPRFFFDDSLTPQGYGTGTEEWGGGGDYWGGRNMTLPLAGHPTGKGKPEHAAHPLELVNSAYRFLLADLMPFGRNALIRLEHGGENETKEHYETVTYWYGLPGASLALTDSLDVGDPDSENAHHYRSEDASAPATVVSRYEWGVDHLHGQEIFPAHRETERHTRGESVFTLGLAPNALGVMLRRTMDYLYPNQRAEVYVAPAGADGTPAGEWSHAGTWFTPGSNTCVYSRPQGKNSETAPTEHNERTVNRRFRQSEFLIGRDLVEGRSAIAVRVRFAPFEVELYPGKPFPEESAWSEIRYDCYCYVMPPAP